MKTTQVARQRGLGGVCGWLAAMGVMAAAACVQAAPATETYVLVKTTDFQREPKSEVMSAAEFKELDKTIQNEAKYFQAALSAAQKEWMADEMNKRTAFPSGKISARKIVGMPDRFPNRDKADAALTAMEERQAKKDARELDRTRGAPQKSKEKLKEEQDKEAAVARAVELLQTKLGDLMSGAKTPAAEAGAPKAGGEKKPVAVPDGGKALNKVL